MALAAHKPSGAYDALVAGLRARIADYNRDQAIGVDPIECDDAVAPPPAAHAHVLVLLTPETAARRINEALSPAQADLVAQLAAGCSVTALAFPPFGTKPRRLPEALARDAAPLVEAALRAAEPTCIVVVGKALAEALYAGCEWGDVPTPGIEDVCVHGKGAREYRHSIVFMDCLEDARLPAQSAVFDKIWERIRSMKRPKRRASTNAFFEPPLKRRCLAGDA